MPPDLAPPAPTRAGPVPAATLDRVAAACAACFPAHEGDCSGFARAVAASLAVALAGEADQIVELLRHDPAWEPVAGGPAAAAAASGGRLVLAGLKGAEQAVPNPHGHVVVVVQGALAQDRYPTGWWGSLGGTPGRARTLNWAWTAADRDRVSYAAHALPVAAAAGGPAKP